MRHRNVRRNFHWKRPTGHNRRETCCKGQVTTKTCCELVFQLSSYQWKNLDGHKSETIQSRLFCSVKIHDQITATWCINSARRRWSSKIWWLDWEVQGKVRWHFAMHGSCLGELLGKKEEERREGFNVAWIFIRPINSSTSEHFRGFQEVILLIRYCKTMHGSWMSSPSNAFEMHSIIKSGLIPGGKSLRTDRQSVFFTAVNPMYARQNLEEVEDDLDKPRIAPCRHTWKAHHNTVFWCNLKLAQRKGSQFYQKIDHMQLIFQAHCQWSDWRKWCAWKLVKKFSARYISPPGYLVLHVCRTRNTIGGNYPLQIRENPMIVRAKSISTGRLEAVVMLILESQECHIPL